MNLDVEGSSPAPSQGGFGLPISRSDRKSSYATGHWPIGDHYARLGIPYNSHFRTFGEEGEMNKQFLCDCSALARTRTLGKSFFENLKEVSSCRIEELQSFRRCSLALITEVMILGVCGIKTTYLSPNWAPRSDH